MKETANNLKINKNIIMICDHHSQIVKLSKILLF